MNNRIGCALTLLIIILITGCRKEGDYEVNCDIKQIIYAYNGETDPLDFSIANFEYTPWGDPRSIQIIQNTKGTGNVSHLFNYDNKKRLVNWWTYLDHNNLFSYRKFIYNNQNIVIRDSFFFKLAGTLTNPIITYSDNIGTNSLVSVNEYSYDSKGRISKIISRFPFLSSPSMRTYNYDQSGNLINGLPYDDKVSIKRTNVIWMFLTTDFSVNNAIRGPITYNNEELPTSGEFSFLNFLSIRNVIYSCDNRNSHH